MAAPHPPYGPNDVSVPLTAQQRATILAWLPKAAVWAVANGWTTSNLPVNYQGMSDDELLKLYGMYYAVVSLHIPGLTGPQNAGSVVNPLTGQDVQNPITSLNQFLTQLSNPNLWIRVAEFTVGGLILIVGLNAALRPGRSLSSMRTTPAGRVVRAVHNSAHGSFQH